MCCIIHTNIPVHKENTMLNLDNIEIWKPIPNFENYYEISTLGRVRNKSNKILKYFINNSGYCCIDFRVNKVRTKHLIHRLVLLTFTENPDNLPEVNHLDENKTNNCLTNLEWCSSSQNKQHSIATGRYNNAFATPKTLGKKHLPNTLSKFHNVSFDKHRNKWIASVRVNGKNLEQKRFNTEIEAALHVNYILTKYNITDRPHNII